MRLKVKYTVKFAVCNGLGHPYTANAIVILTLTLTGGVALTPRDLVNRGGGRHEGCPDELGQLGDEKIASLASCQLQIQMRVLLSRVRGPSTRRHDAPHARNSEDLPATHRVKEREREAMAGEKEKENTVMLEKILGRGGRRGRNRRGRKKCLHT